MRLTGAGKDRGLTLLELVVAIVILSIGSLAAIRATDQSRRVIGQDRARILAHEVALNRIEELRFGTGASTGTVMMGGLRFEVDTTFLNTDAGLRQASVAVTGPYGQRMLLVAYLVGD